MQDDVTIGAAARAELMDQRGKPLAHNVQYLLNIPTDYATTA